MIAWRDWRICSNNILVATKNNSNHQFKWRLAEYIEERWFTFNEACTTAQMRGKEGDIDRSIVYTNSIKYAEYDTISAHCTRSKNTKWIRDSLSDSAFNIYFFFLYLEFVKILHFTRIQTANCSRFFLAITSVVKFCKYANQMAGIHNNKRSGLFFSMANCS